jgi:hypothetical protein
MENLDALLAILPSRDLLLRLSGCSTTLWKVLLLRFFLNFHNSKSSVLMCLSVHILDAHLEEYLLIERPIVMSSPMHLMPLLNALLEELLESLVILFL